MGALTSNNKRDPYSNSPDFHISKKPRLSSFSSTNQTLGSSNGTVSRISRYPETTSKFRREVHAPCRILKFGLSSSSNSKHIDLSAAAGDMGCFFSKRLDSAKRSAFGAFRYLRGKDKYEMIDDVDTECGKVVSVSEDSSVEEVVEVVEEHRREERRLVDGVVVNQDDNNDVKVVEERSVVTVDGNVGVQSAGKMLDSLALDREVEVLSIEVYKKLLESAERRNVRLQALDSDIEFNQKKLIFYRSTRPAKKPEVKEIPQEPFIPLTEEEESAVKRAFSVNNRRRVLVTHKNSNIDITGELLHCLAPGAWLNDEVINVYLELLKEREKRNPQKFLKCHFFNSFFYKKLTGGGKNIYDYRAVKRWTTERKLGYFLIDCDKIFVPVHREIHWCLAIINKKDRKFQYLDSLKGRDFRVLKNLAKYYVEEVKDKSKNDIDVSNWEHEFLEDLPEQQNGYDCGMFMIKYADFYSRGIGLCFSQDHMPYFRMRTAKEILRLRAD